MRRLGREEVRCHPPTDRHPPPPHTHNALPCPAVGDFKQLALRADQDGHLRQKLQHTLKLSKEKWDEAREHSMRAVVADSRMRAWYPDRRSLDTGVLFTCRLGVVDLERPVGEGGREGGV